MKMRKIKYQVAYVRDVVCKFGRGLVRPVVRADDQPLSLVYRALPHVVDVRPSVFGQRVDGPELYLELVDEPCSWRPASCRLRTTWQVW